MKFLLRLLRRLRVTYRRAKYGCDRSPQLPARIDSPILDGLARRR